MSYEVLCPNCFVDRRGQEKCWSCEWNQLDSGNDFLPLLPHTVLSNNYLIGRVLGQGGFGITYVAMDLKKSEKLAIKEYLSTEFAGRSRSNAVIPHSRETRDLFSKGLLNFREEASELAKLRHASIVTVFDYFEENGTGYLVMEYLGDTTLSNYLDQNSGKVGYELTKDILLRIMDGLRAIHARNLYHRDVSPDNICLTPEATVKLIDFSAARYRIAREHPKSLSIIVKDGYAPVEQYYTSGIQGAWTDVYSLAATMYRAITGRVPPSSLERQSHDELVPPRELGVQIPPFAEKAMLRALAVQAADRYQNVADFQTALLQSVPDRPPWLFNVLVGAMVLCFVAAIVALSLEHMGWALSFAVSGVVLIVLFLIQRRNSDSS